MSTKAMPFTDEQIEAIKLLVGYPASDSTVERVLRNLDAVLAERDALRAQLAAIRTAWRAHDAARSTYLEAWGTAEACETEAERAYYETSQALAAMMREP